MSKITVVNIKTLAKNLGLKKVMNYSFLSFGHRSINAREVDFSGITIVLGKNGGVSSKIVDKVSNKLQTLGINYYVSDIDKLMLNILQQAALENPKDKLVAIRVGGEYDDLNKIAIITDTRYGSISKSDFKNSDSLALMLNSSINNSVIVSGKRDINSKYPLRVNTALARFVDKNDFNNPMVKNVTISINDGLNTDLNEISDGIVSGITKFCCLSNEEQNKPYLISVDKDCFDGELSVCESKPLQSNFDVIVPVVKERVY